MVSRSAGQAKSLFFERLLLPGGWARDARIVIDGGVISTIETAAESRPGDERHACGLPGLPNLHSHAFQRGMAGLAERRGPAGDSFWTWRDIMYRFVERMTPDDVEAIAALAYAEMLEGGFTRVGEFHYLHHDRGGARFADIARMSGAIVAAAERSGIALTLLPVFYAHAGFGAQPPRADQARFILDIDGYADLLEGTDRAVAALPDGVVGVAPHSLRAVSPEQLRKLEALATGRPVHIHVAEQVKEVEDCIAWSGQRPVEWLLDHAGVDGRWCLVHATHITDDEAIAIARSGAVAGLCPITEANLGDGLFPAEVFLGAGGRYGVGSDSNVLIDGAEEIRLLEYGQRLARGERNVLAGGVGRSTGAALHSGAIVGGAAALGVAAGLAIGAAADVISLDLRHPSFASRDANAIIDAYIFTGGGRAIDCVWRRGEKLVSAGRHRARDAIVDRYHDVLSRIIT